MNNKNIHKCLSLKKNKARNEFVNVFATVERKKSEQIRFIRYCIRGSSLVLRPVLQIRYLQLQRKT